MNDWSTAIARPAQLPTIHTAPRTRGPAIDAAVNERSGTRASSGKLVASAVVVYGLLVSLIYFDTLASMVSIWYRSQTFAHGFLILPISLWLTWRLRQRFAALRVQPEFRALVLLVAAGVAWLLGRLVDVQVLQQLAFVAVLISGIWAIVGTQVARCYAFPLGFLFLGVPMGAGLIPPLMELTADTTEYLLRATGIPVLREGMYLSLPTGTWSVIEECSGVRYLIASLTLGLVYAYLTYHSFWRRLAFLALAIAVPILANTLRAYAVVMVGHLSEMRYGVGADHLYFGWVLFGLAMLLMFWLGGFWQQSPSAAVRQRADTTSPSDKTTSALLLSTALALLCAGSWPALVLSMNRNADSASEVALEIPASMGSWNLVQFDEWNWAPAQPGADLELDLRYVSDAFPEPVTAGVHVRQYLQQRQGTELVTNTEPWRPDRKAWRVIGQQRTLVNLDQPFTVDEVQVVSAQHELLVWSWYRIDGHNTSNAYLAKFFEARQQIVEGRRQGARLFLVTPVGENNTQARQVLQDFLVVSHAAFEAAVDQDSDSSIAEDAGVSE